MVLLPLRERLEETWEPLRWLDTSDVEDVRGLDQRRHGASPFIRRANARSDDVGGLPRSERALHEVSLLGGQKPERARLLEQPAEPGEADRPLVVGRRKEHGPIGHEREPERGREVEVRIEDEYVVVPVHLHDAPEQAGRERPLSEEPHGLEERERPDRPDALVHPAAQPVLDPLESLGHHREALDLDPVESPRDRARSGWPTFCGRARTS